VCERYVIPEQSEVEGEFRVAHSWWTFQASFNVSPSRNVPVIRIYDGQCEGVMLRWGLIPDWAQGDASIACAAHMPIDELERSATVNGAWSRGRRCILPAFGFYGWRLVEAGHRQPFFIRLVNRTVFGVAALWDRSINEDGDDVIESCALLTVPANSLMAEVDNTTQRMPAILCREAYEIWLSAPIDVAQSVLRAYPQDQMLAHAVSPRVNSLAHDDAGLIESVEQHARRCA
jgi:putative SOS response-associated peptidase YedK